MTTTNKTFYHEQGSKRTRLSVTRFCWTFIPVEFKRTGIMERPQARRCIFRHFRIKLSNSSLEVLFRSSHPEVFCKKGILRSFTKFTGKHLCHSLFLNKVADRLLQTLAQVFSCEFCEISKNIFFIEHVLATASL